MKRKLWTLAAIGFLTAGAVHGGNLLTNPGFETEDFTGWSNFGPNWRIGSGADAHEGSFGVVYDVYTSHAGDDWAGIFQNVPIMAGNYYKAGAFLRTVNLEPGTTSSSFFELQWLDSGNGVITQEATSWVDSDQAFTFLGFESRQAPANAAAVGIRGIVRIVNPPAGDTEFHNFDSFLLEDVTPAHTYLNNWGFEDDFNGWEVSGQGWRISTGQDAYAFDKGAVNDVRDTDWDEWRVISQKVPVIAGVHYSLGAYIRAVSVDASTSFLELDWLNSSGGLISRHATPYVDSDQPFTLSALNDIVAPANAVTAMVKGVVWRDPSFPADNIDFHIFDEFYFLRPVDLAISITASTDQIEANQYVTYTITVSNRSPTMSGSYTVQNTLDANLTIHSVSDGGVVSGSTVSWTLFGLQGNSSRTLTVTATTPFTGDDDEVPNVVSASVSSTIGDFNPDNTSVQTETRTVGIPMFSTLALLLLGGVVVYVFQRSYRLNPCRAE